MAGQRGTDFNITSGKYSEMLPFTASSRNSISNFLISDSADVDAFIIPSKRKNNEAEDEMLIDTGNSESEFRKLTRQTSGSENVGFSLPVRMEVTETLTEDSLGIGDKSILTSEHEEGELSGDEEEQPTSVVQKTRHLKELSDKLYKRAQRFGTEFRDLPVDDLDKLYQSLDIPAEQWRPGKLKNVRLNAVHIRGVEEMDTTDVIKYFEDYKPLSVEWVNETSCNVVFENDMQAAKAVWGMSTEMPESASVPEGKASSSIRSVISYGGNSDNEGQEAKGGYNPYSGPAPFASGYPVPRGKWRRGRISYNSRFFHMRFATKNDHKMPNPYKWNANSQNREDPNYGGMKGSMPSNRKFQSNLFRSDRHFNRSYTRPYPYAPSYDSNYEGLRSRTPRNENEASTSGEGRRHISPLMRSNQQETSTESDDENTLSVRGKKVRMHMYADDFKGSWQQVSSPGKMRSDQLHYGPLNEVSQSNMSTDIQETRVRPEDTAEKKQVPARYKIWNPLAERMAEESERVEERLNYMNSADLRNRINSPPYRPSSRYSGGESSVKIDLRRKLQEKGEAAKHLSPLLISVKNYSEKKAVRRDVTRDRCSMNDDGDDVNDDRDDVHNDFDEDGDSSY